MDTAKNVGDGPDDPGTPRPRVIKRYANRKLYDTHASRYVTLQQIADLVRQGFEVSIIDNTTKEDLTNVTLAQILYESEKNGAGPKRAPQAALKTLIQKGGELITTLRDGPVGKLVTDPIGTLRRDDDSVEEPATTGPATEPAAPLQVSEDELKDDAAPKERRSMVASSKEALDELQKAADDRLRAIMATAMGHVQHLQSEVRRLQARIEVLEARLRKRADSQAPPSEAPPDEHQS